MNKFVFSILGMLLSASVSAQPKDDFERKVYKNVEVMPNFPGGMEAFYKFIGENFVYPESARKIGVEGRVITSFVVEKNGSLTDIKLVRGVGLGCDEETIRVLKLSPKWTPGLQGGKNVRVQYILPLKLKLEGE